MRIWDFEFDEHNEAEMAAHGVTPREALEVLDSEGWRITVIGRST
jgi:hypothetical protein